MKHKTFRKIALFAFALFFMQVASGQPVQKTNPKNAKITIDLKSIEFDISDVFRTVALELKKIDFEKIGMAVEAAGRDIGREIGDIEVIVIDKNGFDNTNAQPLELIGTEEKSKTITKTYSVNGNDKLSINNQYGKVSVNVWAKNEIKVNVEIKAFESSESSALELLESVKIAESHVGDLISFKTNFEKTSLNFWSRVKNGKEERRGVQVNYEIYMPANNPLDINNRYGSTVLADFNGPVNISSSYGSFSAGKLDNPANQVKVNYGSATIENFSNGNLSVAYSRLKLNHADKVNANIKYSSANISRLTNGGTFDLGYTSGFKIDHVDKNVKNLIINSSYSGVTLGIDESSNCDFDVTVSYAGFNYNNDKINLINQLTDEKAKGWNPTKNYKGRLGKGSDSRIIIKSNYGGVKFL